MEDRHSVCLDINTLYGLKVKGERETQRERERERGFLQVEVTCTFWGWEISQCGIMGLNSKLVGEGGG